MVQKLALNKLMEPLCIELIHRGWKALLEVCHPPFFLPASYSMLRSFGLLPNMHVTVQPSVKTVFKQGDSILQPSQKDCKLYLEVNGRAQMGHLNPCCLNCVP